MGRIDGRSVTPTTPAFGGLSPVFQTNKVTPSPAQPLFQQFDQLNAGTAQGSALTDVSLETPAHPETHQVKRGESLSTIAKKYFGNSNLYMELFKANQDILTHPNQLTVGMTIKLPSALFPASESEAKSQVLPGASLNAYRNQNPLSYITLAPGKPSPEVSNPLEATSSPLLQELMGHQGDFEHFLKTPDKQRTGQNIIDHDDAVKVNKRFDIHPGLTLQTLKTQLPAWAEKVSAVLAENHAKITLPTASGEGKTVDSAFFQNLAARVKAGEYNQVKQDFQNQFGIGFVNTLFAVDDVAANIQNDPYYQAVKEAPKTIDLDAVSEEFNLASDKLNYLAHTPAHGHKQIPVQLEMNAADLQRATTPRSAQDMIQDLSGFFNAKGVLTQPTEFENKVYEILNDSTSRRTLIEHFKLNSEANLSALVPAVTGESGMAASQIDYNSYFAVASVMMNRALGRNLKKAALQKAQGVPEAKFKPVSLSEIIKEKGQFEIVWRKMPNGKTFYEYNQAQNQAFLNGKLKADGNSYRATKLAYEVSQDLFSGMNRLSAEVDGIDRKGMGRSTAQLFYFNQSRSQDYSRNKDAAVALIDNNNTHVFFKAWDDIAYFR